jgi:hypothetical protein
MTRGIRPPKSIRHGDQEIARRLPRRLRVAQLVGELLSPPPIIVVLALVVAWDSSPTPGMAILWGAIAALFASVLPYAIILRGVRRGRLSDKNISLREERIRFGVAAITSILIGLAVLAAFNAPAEAGLRLGDHALVEDFGSCRDRGGCRHRVDARLWNGTAGRVAPHRRDCLVPGRSG